MGWSGYTNMTAEEAVRHELRGNDIIAKSGAWWLVRINRPGSDWHGHVTLVHALTQRSGGEVMVKLVDASMGPNGTPPKTLFRRWLRESVGQDRGQFEVDFINRVEREHEEADSAKSLSKGDEFTFGSEFSFSDGVKESTFIYVEKYRARRKCDGVVVRLPRDFRTRITVLTLT